MKWYVWAKNCQRCGGDLNLTWDYWEGYYVACLQCSASANKEHEASLMRELPTQYWPLSVKRLLNTVEADAA